MNREVVIVLGLTGFGKSLWTKLQHKLLQRTQQRTLVYDPSITYQCEWAEGTDIYNYVCEEQQPQFNFGLWQSEEVERLGDIGFAVGNMTLIIEECANVFPKGLARLPEWAKNCIFFGRHRAMSLYLVAQRPISIPIDFRSQANRVVSFQQHEGDDLTWMVDTFGKQNARLLSSLPRWTCLDCHNGEIVKYSIVEQVRRELDISLDIRKTSDIL